MAAFGKKMFERTLKIAVPPSQSIFLWGPRQTGKSSFLKKNFPEAIYYDLLETDQVVRLTKSPQLLREELLSKSAAALKHLVIIDEIQKVPELLNEVHWLIENKGMQFILCGSSARQLKKQSVNLLGGRAWIYHFYPLTYAEIPDFDLLRALQQGLIPRHYLSAPANINDYLQAYVNAYLTEEIRNEGLARNLAGFARFLDIAGLCNGEMLNFTNVARDCFLDRNSVQGYYQILVDTLLGYFIYPYNKKKKRELVMATPKFYLCDVGIANYLARQTLTDLKGTVAGKSFEHYILMELMAYRGLKRKRFEISYWRTKSGLEVDFIIGDAQIALEVKISTQVHQQDLKGLIAFCEEHEQVQAVVVSQDHKPRVLQVTEKIAIQIMPWRVFLESLWLGKYI